MMKFIKSHIANTIWIKSCLLTNVSDVSIVRSIKADVLQTQMTDEEAFSFISLDREDSII